MNDGSHTMELPGGGPSLTVRGYLDLDFGAGSFANPVVFLNDNVSRSGFQAGELTLMTSSQLSPKLSFMSELPSPPTMLTRSMSTSSATC